jgi:bifunctional non-homologous end joining protein LigD
MSVSERRRVQAAIPLQPCLPRRAHTPPTGSGWIHEIKHDGFRILARRESDCVRLFTRNGYDFTARYPKIAAALESLPVRSCVVDGEAIVVDERGPSVFDILRFRLRDDAAVLCAFDLVQLDGEDLRWQPLEYRKATLADLLQGVRDGIAFNQHFSDDGASIFRHACALGCEGIVSKRLGSHPFFRSDWHAGGMPWYFIAAARGSADERFVQRRAPGLVRRLYWKKTVRRWLRPRTRIRAEAPNAIRR